MEKLQYTQHDVDNRVLAEREATIHGCIAKLDRLRKQFEKRVTNMGDYQLGYLEAIILAKDAIR